MIERSPERPITPATHDSATAVMIDVEGLRADLSARLEEARDTAATLLTKHDTDEAALESPDYNLALGKVIGLEIATVIQESIIESLQSPVPDDLSTLLPPAANM